MSEPELIGDVLARVLADLIEKIDNKSGRVEDPLPGGGNLGGKETERGVTT